MTVIIHCLRVWRHYLLDFHFTIMTDNVATSYFQTQKKLSPKQARWQDFLAEFDYQLEYKPGKANVVADALSCKAELTTLSMSQPKYNLVSRIKEDRSARKRICWRRCLRGRQGDFGRRKAFSSPKEISCSCQGGEICGKKSPRSAMT